MLGAYFLSGFLPKPLARGLSLGLCAGMSSSYTLPFVDSPAVPLLRGVRCVAKSAHGDILSPLLSFAAQALALGFRWKHLGIVIVFSLPRAH